MEASCIGSIVKALEGSGPSHILLRLLLLDQSDFLVSAHFSFPSVRDSIVPHDLVVLIDEHKAIYLLLLLVNRRLILSHRGPSVRVSCGGVEQSLLRLLGALTVVPGHPVHVLRLNLGGPSGKDRECLISIVLTV